MLAFSFVSREVALQVVQVDELPSTVFTRACVLPARPFLLVDLFDMFPKLLLGGEAALAAVVLARDELRRRLVVGYVRLQVLGGGEAPPTRAAHELLNAVVLARGWFDAGFTRGCGGRPRAVLEVLVVQHV